MTPQLVMIAGPNGAGKSTFYELFLADSPLPFVNADLFAAETGVDSFEAARILDATRARMIEDGLGFITETVFSDPYGHKLTLLRDAISAGFEVTLIFIGIATAALSALRVAQRVEHGGHDVPRDRLKSRFKRSLANLREATAFVPTIELFDNSFVESPYRHVATIRSEQVVMHAAGALPRWCRDIVPAQRTPAAKRATKAPKGLGGERSTKQRSTKKNR